MKKIIILCVLLGACRPDPGKSFYDEYQEEFNSSGSDDGGSGDVEFIQGPDPFVDGENRLSLGMFYEGMASETMELDNESNAYYIYENTISIENSTERVEGVKSDRIELTGKAWWGCGIHWSASRDLSFWTTLHVSFNSSDEAFSEIQIEMIDTDSRSVKARNYGYTNDGNWHHLAIPIADFVAQGLDAAAVEVPFVLAGGAGDPGESLLVDNLYLTTNH